MRRLQPTWLARGDATVAGVGLIGAGLVSQSLLMARGAALGYGPICGNHALTAVHCAGCYVALAAVAVGLGLAASGVSPLAQALLRRRRS